MLTPSFKNKSTLTNSKNEKLNEHALVKTLTFIGLTASNTTTLGTSIEEGVVGTPTIDIEANLTVYFDYSTNVSPSPDLTKVSAFFNNLEVGYTFTVASGKYNFEEYDLSGIYSFVYFLNNIVIATGITMTNYTPGKFNKEQFDATPILNISRTITTPTATNTFIIINKFSQNPNNSFKSARLQSTDLLEIFDKKYKVISVVVDHNKNEIVKLGFDNESPDMSIPTLIETEKTLINVYRLIKK